jgi:glyceraldehyde 3-phosphate dehydrogenase
MTVYAVNGLGRIGKLALKPLLERGRRSPGSTMPWAIRRCMRICWSSTRCTGAGTRISQRLGERHIDGVRLPFVGTRDLSALPLDGIDVVIDCTGVFKTRQSSRPISRRA